MKKTVLLSVSALLVTLLLSVTVNSGVIAAARVKDAPVSPALAVIASYTPMAKTGLVGNEILFSPADFERALNLSRVDAITVTRLPSAADGELLIGSVVVREGQTISRENLSLLSYAPALADNTYSEFDFSVGNGGWSMTCGLYMLDSINRNPTTAAEQRTVSTYRDVAAYGKLYAHDPEGDELTYQIIDYPDHGVALLYDDEGRYVYMPNRDFVGTDSLSYVVYDKYGNYSTAATVSLEINRNTASLVYSDMKWNAAYGAALSLAERGIMSGTRVGNTDYFYPQSRVQRGDFLVMAMKAAGITSLPTVTDSGFADDADIPAEMKPYAAVAARAGYIEPQSVDGNKCLLPQSELTVAEAARICANIMDLKYDGSVAVSVDEGTIPAAAREAVLAMAAAGIIDGGRIADYGAPVTRDLAAVMLAALVEG